MTVRFRLRRTVASSSSSPSLSDSSSSEESEVVMLAAKERGAVELRVGGVRDMNRWGWGAGVEEAEGGVPSADEILRFRI